MRARNIVVGTWAGLCVTGLAVTAFLDRGSGTPEEPEKVTIISEVRPVDCGPYVQLPQGSPYRGVGNGGTVPNCPPAPGAG